MILVWVIKMYELDSCLQDICIRYVIESFFLISTFLM